MQVININGLNKFYGRKQVLFDIDLDFPQAQMVALIGPSGSVNPRSYVTSMV